MRFRRRDPTPLVCVCPYPRPQQVRLFGWIPVPDAYECGRCYRRVWSCQR